MADTKSQALVTRDEAIVGEVIDSGLAVKSRYDELLTRVNIIAPVITGYLAPHHVVNVSPIRIDPTIDEYGSGTMVYRDRAFMKENERGLLKVSLDQIANSVGITWLPEPHSRRLDDGSKRHYWAFTAVGVLKVMDGSFQVLKPGSAEADLRDESEQIGGWSEEKWAELQRRNKGLPKDQQEKSIGGWTDKRVHNARRFGLQLAETKAQSRVIRNLGLRQKYTVDELRRGFAAFRVTYNPDMSNPMVAQIVTQHNLMGITALYARGAAQPALPAGDSTTVAMGMADVAPHDPEPFTPASVPSKEIPFDDLPEDADDDSSLITIDHVGKSEDTDDYFIYTVDGRKLHTSDKDVARACNVARKNKVPIPVDVNGSEILEIVVRTTEKL